MSVCPLKAAKTSAPPSRLAELTATPSGLAGLTGCGTGSPGSGQVADGQMGAKRDGEAEGTEGSNQPGCREIPLSVKEGVLGEGDSETGTE